MMLLEALRGYDMTSVNIIQVQRAESILARIGYFTLHPSYVMRGILLRNAKWSDGGGWVFVVDVTRGVSVTKGV